MFSEEVYFLLPFQILYQTFEGHRVRSGRHSAQLPLQLQAP